MSKDKETKTETKTDNGLAATVRGHGKLLRAILDELKEFHWGAAIVKKVERAAGVDLDGDGKMGVTRLAMCALVTIMFVCTIAGVAYGRRVWGWDDTTIGQAEVTTDDAGTSTLTVDALTAAGLLDSDTTGVTGNFEVGTNLTVAGTSTLSNTLTVTAGGIANTGGITSDTANVTGAIVGGSTLDITGDATLSGDLSVAEIFGTTPVTITVTNAQAITVTGSYLQLDTTTAGGSTNTLSVGTVTGQMLIIENVCSTNITFADATTSLALGSDVDLGVTDILMLIRSASGQWRKVSSSDN